MKSFSKFVLLLLTLSLLTACAESRDETTFTMEAKLLSVGEKLEVEVTKSEYSSGIFHIIISDKTKIYDKDGTEVEKSKLPINSIISIIYSGQIMMSYPPQTVAIKITVKE